MKIQQNPINLDLDENITKLLKDVRKQRNFDVDLYLDIKSKLIHNYFTKYNLNTAIVAMSGGVDSATVLGILKYTKQKYNSFEIVPITIPFHNNNGVTNQSDSMNKAIEQCKKYNLDCITFNLESVSKNIIENFKTITNINPSDWAIGQLILYLRTPILYYLATNYSDINQNAIIVGTTNRDEGA
jgi:NH3-dependent NAD+ synthetase